MSGVDQGLVERFAELIVGFGANVQPGQIVAVGAEPGKEQLGPRDRRRGLPRGREVRRRLVLRPCTSSARGSSTRRRTRSTTCRRGTARRVLALGELRGARIALTGAAAPGLLDDLDPVRAGRDRLPAVKEVAEVVNRADDQLDDRALPDPRLGGARASRPRPRRRARAPVGADRARLPARRARPGGGLGASACRPCCRRAERLTERRFDALHSEGPGTDLRVGLLPGSRWLAARFETVDGIVHMPNLPTEEVFTTPDPAARRRRRARDQAARAAAARSSAACGCASRAAAPSRSRPRPAPRRCARRVARDEGAARLGEVALVDREGRIGALDTVFYDTLLDENAASHIALGRGFPFSRRRADRERVNVARDPHRLHDRRRRGRRDGHHRGAASEVPVLRSRGLADLSTAGRVPLSDPQERCRSG